MNEIVKVLIEKYEELRENRQQKIEAFNNDERPFLVVASPLSYDAFFKCNSVEESFESNISILGTWLLAPLNSSNRGLSGEPMSIIDIELNVVPKSIPITCLGIVSPLLILPKPIVIGLRISFKYP